MTNYRGGPPGRDVSTGPGETGDHFDTDTLADHTEGLLEPARDAHVRAHIAWCTDCSGVVDQLNSVRTVLSSLPAPSMPDDVMARIDASLAQAQSERASMTRSDEPATQPRRRSWVSALFHRPGLLASAAVFVVGIAFVGGYLTTRGDDGDGNSAVPSSGNAVPTTKNDPMITGRSYTTDHLAGQARSLVAEMQSDSYTPDPSMSKSMDAELQRLSDPKEFDKCAAAVTGDKLDRVVAIDLGKFDQRPAAIVVMKTTNAKMYEVTAVGPGCTEGDAKIIYTTTITRK